MQPANIVVFAIPLLLLAFMFNAQRKRQRAFSALQDGLAAGQDVVTTSGLHGRVVQIDDAVAVLEIAPGTRVRWDRRAIGSVVTATGATESVPPPADAPTTPEDR